MILDARNTMGEIFEPRQNKHIQLLGNFTAFCNPRFDKFRHTNSPRHILACHSEGELHCS